LQTGVNSSFELRIPLTFSIEDLELIGNIIDGEVRELLC